MPVLAYAVCLGVLVVVWWGGGHADNRYRKNIRAHISSLFLVPPALIFTSNPPYRPLPRMEDDVLASNFAAASRAMPSPAVALTPVEAQRAVALLHDLAQKVALLGSIPTSSSLAATAQSYPDNLAANPHHHGSTTVHHTHRNEDELSKFVRDEFHRHLAEQHRLEAHHRELIRQWHDLVVGQTEENNEDGIIANTKNPSPLLDTVQTEMTEVGQALTHNSGILLRQLKEHPRFSGFDLKVDLERKELARLLDITTQELERMGTFVALETAVEEARRAQDQLAQVAGQEQGAASTASQLEQALRDASTAHQERVAQQQAAIAELKRELDRLQYKHEVTLKYTRREAQAEASGVQRLYRLEEKDLERKQARLLAQQALEEQSHRDLMTYLREKQQELQGQLAMWTTKAQQDFGRLDAETEKITAARDAYAGELESLRARRKVELAEDVARTTAVLALREEEKAKEALRVKSLELAALKIGKAVRRYTLHVKQQRDDQAGTTTGKAEGEGGEKKKKKKGKDGKGKAASPKAGAAAGKKAPAAAPSKKPAARTASPKPADKAQGAAGKAPAAAGAAPTAAGGGGGAKKKK